MSKILLNDKQYIDGEFSFDVSYDVSVNPPLMQINGVLSSKNGYLPEIFSLENERYAITGINVYQESFGSEEDTMVYHFEAKAYGLADYLKEVKLNG